MKIGANLNVFFILINFRLNRPIWPIKMLKNNFFFDRNAPGITGTHQEHFGHWTDIQNSHITLQGLAGLQGGKLLAAHRFTALRPISHRLVSGTAAIGLTRRKAHVHKTVARSTSGQFHLYGKKTLVCGCGWGHQMCTRLRSETQETTDLLHTRSAAEHTSLHHRPR